MGAFTEIDPQKLAACRPCFSKILKHLFNRLHRQLSKPFERRNHTCGRGRDGQSNIHKCIVWPERH